MSPTVSKDLHTTVISFKVTGRLFIPYSTLLTIPSIGRDPHVGLSAHSPLAAAGARVLPVAGIKS